MKISSLTNSLKRSPRKLLSIIVPALLFLLGWWFGLPAETDHRAETGGQQEIWTCSMHPQIRQPNPGLCPICNMDLILLRHDGSGGMREVKISAETAALMNLRVSPVTRGPASAEVRLFGRIDYDERQLATITSRVAGRLDRLFVDFTGAEVRADDHLAEIYSPDLMVAQRELILAKRSFLANKNASPVVRDTYERMLKSSREKLRLLQFTDQQIESIENASEPSDHLTLYSPQTGIVTAKYATEGQYVKTGDPLFKIASLSTVWLRLEAYENDLQWLRYAQDVEFTVDAIPGRTFRGPIVFIDPEIDPMRRIAKLRVNVANPDLALKPGMFASATVQSATAADGRVLDPSLAGKWISPMHPEIIKDAPGTCDICGMDLVPAEEFGAISKAGSIRDPLLVPATAVLRTGERAVVYVQIGSSSEPAFEGREIVLGPRVGQHFIVASGLEKGELVVTRGAFKLDSELQIKAKPSMMNPNAGLEEKPTTAAPADLAGQWSAMPRLLHQLITNPQAATIQQMDQFLGGIDTEWLQPDELQLWNEFSRRLANELKLAEMEFPTQPQAAIRRIARSFEDVGRHLGLPYQPQAGAQADPQVAQRLKPVIAAYLPVAQALANDDDPAAQSAADALVHASSGNPSLHAIATQVAAAANIEDRRRAFKTISDALIQQIRRDGIDAVGTAYVVHCPMAFGDTGADWISSTPQILNPYFGDAMLNCGSIKESLSLGGPPLKPQEKPQTAPQTHDH